MLNADLLLKPIIASTGKSPMQTLNDAGVEYYAYRQRIKKREVLRLSYLEGVVHALGYRLELRILDNEGNVLSRSVSDPEHPLLSEEYKAKARERAERTILQCGPQERLSHSLETRRRKRDEALSAALQEQGEDTADR